MKMEFARNPYLIVLQETFCEYYFLFYPRNIIKFNGVFRKRVAAIFASYSSRFCSLLETLNLPQNSKSTFETDI